MDTSFDLYERLIAAGWKRERARGVLGTAVYTEFIWTVNAWSLMNWLAKRLHKSAQWEHREYALAVKQIYEDAMPVTAAAFEEYVLE
jgi:thymidylate synthase (FAD)